MPTNKVHRSCLSRLTVSATLVAAAFFGLPSDEAHAYIKCDVSTSCTREASSQGQQTRQRITDMERSITRTLLEVAERLIGAMREQTGAIAASDAQNTQAEGENAQAIAQAAGAISQEDRHQAMECGSLAAAAAGRSGGITSAPSKVKSRVDKANSGLSRNTNASLDTGLKQKDLPPENPSLALTRVGAGGCEDFADGSKNSALTLLCSAAGVPTKGSSPYPNADVSAQTLLLGPESLNNPTAILSVPDDGPEAGARQAHRNLLFEANPVPMPNETTLKDTDFARELLGLYRIYRAGKDLAIAPTDEWTALTTVSPETIPALKEVDQDFMVEYLKGSPERSYKNGVSPWALLDIQVESRVGNKNWLKDMSAAPPEVKQNEQLAMQALGLRIELQRLKAQYQTNILLGKLLDATIESTQRESLETMIEKVGVEKIVTDMQAGAKGTKQP